MTNRLDRDFHLPGLLRFALPTIIMMLVVSLYTIVDGVLIARLVGENALAAANVAYPAISFTLAMGIMLGTGGSAVVAHKMGAGYLEEARRDFGFLALVAVCIGLAVCLAGALFAGPLARLLGASDLLLDDTVTYLRVQLCFAPMAMLQLLFESFFVTAGRPGLGLGLATAAGVTNAVLDYLYMGPMQMGILGAALGTVTGYSIPAVAGVLFFLLRRQGLRFGRPHGDLRMLGRACFNGASEMVTNLSMAVTTFLFNAIMMAYLGEAGVSAITIVLYAQFLLVALYMGFSMGVAPVFSFNRGAGRYDRMRRIFGYCLRFILVSSVAILAVALALSGVVVGIFSTPGSPVYAIALARFPLCRGKYLLLRPLYRPVRWAHLRHYLVCPHLRLPAAGAASAAPAAGGGRRVAGRAAGGAALLPAVGLVPPPQAGRLRLRRWGSPPTRWTRRRTDLTEAKPL